MGSIWDEDINDVLQDENFSPTWTYPRPSGLLTKVIVSVRASAMMFPVVVYVIKSPHDQSDIDQETVLAKLTLSPGDRYEVLDDLMSEVEELDLVYVLVYEDQTVEGGGEGQAVAGVTVECVFEEDLD